MEDLLRSTHTCIALLKNNVLIQGIEASRDTVAGLEIRTKVNDNTESDVKAYDSNLSNVENTVVRKGNDYDMYKEYN